MTLTRVLLTRMLPWAINYFCRVLIRLTTTSLVAMGGDSHFRSFCRIKLWNNWIVPISYVCYWLMIFISHFKCHFKKPNSFSWPMYPTLPFMCSSVNDCFEFWLRSAREDLIEIQVERLKQVSLHLNEFWVPKREIPFLPFIHPTIERSTRRVGVDLLKVNAVEGWSMYIECRRGILDEVRSIIIGT